MELEVECRRHSCAVILCSVYPSLRLLDIAEVLSDGELHTGMVVIVCYIAGREALHHIVSEACVAEVVNKIFGVCLYAFLHVCRFVVEVSHAAPSLSCVVVSR